MPPHEGHCRNPNNSKDAVTMTWRGGVALLGEGNTSRISDRSARMDVLLRHERSE